jgi:FkbM family methyltransferase
MARFFRWQIGSLLLGSAAVVPFVNDARLIVRRGMTGATGNLYYGLMEFEDMALTCHFLRPDDLFGDVGANVGVYSVLSSAVVGARSRAIEPLPHIARALLDNVAINNIPGRVELYEVGVGAEAGTLRFSSELDTTNHVLTSAETDQPGQDVPVRTLDAIFSDEVPIMLKIDVEGFEWPVLQGAKSILADPKLQVIIIELNNSGARYGVDDAEIHACLLEFGFSPYRYEPMKRRLLPVERYGSHNTAYLRRPEEAQERVATAPPFTVLGHVI